MLTLRKTLSLKNPILSASNELSSFCRWRVWNIMRIIKMWPRDWKWATAVGKMAPIDLLNAGLPQTFSLQKIQYLRSTVKQTAIKWGLPVGPCGVGSPSAGHVGWPLAWDDSILECVCDHCCVTKPTDGLCCFCLRLCSVLRGVNVAEFAFFFLSLACILHFNLLWHLCSRLSLKQWIEGLLAQCVHICYNSW